MDATMMYFNYPDTDMTLRWVNLKRTMRVRLPSRSIWFSGWRGNLVCDVLQLCCVSCCAVIGHGISLKAAVSP